MHDDPVVHRGACVKCLGRMSGRLNVPEFRESLKIPAQKRIYDNYNKGMIRPIAE